MINKLHAQLYAEILDRIKWNSKPHFPEIKEEAARNPKRTIFSSLMWSERVGGLKFQSILSRKVCAMYSTHHAVTAVITCVQIACNMAD